MVAESPDAACPPPGVFSQPCRDFLLELRLQDAGDMVRLFDLDHRPILAHFFQRLDLQLLDEVIFLPN